MLPWPIYFLLSAGVYSLFRFFDELSTRKIARILDLQLHEVNPLLTRLIRLVGMDRAFLVLWIVIALGVGALDTYSYVSSTGNFGVPAIAVLLGSVHLLAAAHNWELDSRVRFYSKGEIKLANLRYAQVLERAGRLGRLKLSIERNLYAVYVTALAGIIVMAVNYDPMVGLGLPNPSNPVSLIATQFLSGMLLFAPVMVIGNLVVMRRLVKYGRQQTGSVPM